MKIYVSQLTFKSFATLDLLNPVNIKMRAFRNIVSTERFARAVWWKKSSLSVSMEHVWQPLVAKVKNMNSISCWQRQLSQRIICWKGYLYNVQGDSSNKEMVMMCYIFF